MADPPTSVPSAHSAAVYRYAVELVEDTRRANEGRLGDARELAAVVRIADEPAADRILSAAEEACARDLHIAEQQAEEVVRHARAGIMAAVQRYAQNLVEEARKSGQSRLDKASELAELVRLADAGSADRLLQAIHTVNDAAMRTAERQAQGVLETAQTRLTLATKFGDAASAGPDEAAAAEPAAPAPAPQPAAQESRWPPVPPGGPGPEQAQTSPAPATATDPEAAPAPIEYADMPSHVGEDPSAEPKGDGSVPPVNGVPAQPEQGTGDTVRFRQEGS
ncbi:MAG: hypothetical protein E6I85_07000 [Chloroflexi bacterium]|nr:MAG: hypothetical protein E6I85_07000 [Chloroflexota bacterium]